MKKSKCRTAGIGCSCLSKRSGETNRGVYWPVQEYKSLACQHEPERCPGAAGRLHRVPFLYTWMFRPCRVDCLLQMKQKEKSHPHRKKSKAEKKYGEMNTEPFYI